MKDCPRCQNPIPDQAESCRCGWRERTTRQATASHEPRVDCGYNGCYTESFCKLRTPTGWLNVCEQHYRQYHHDKAEKHCNDKGLDTTAKRKAYLREITDKFPALKAHITREPGDDYEEDQP